MKYLFFFIAGFLFWTQIFAQQIPALTADRLEQLSSVVPGGSTYSLEGFNTRGAGIVGTPYLYNEWITGTVTFSNGEEIENLKLNLDLHNNLLEIKTKVAVKVAKPEHLQSVEVNYMPGEIKKFIPLSEYQTGNNKIGEGFAEVLYDGNIKLVKKTVLEVRKPNYRPAQDVGSHDYEIRKKEKIYLLEEGVLKEMKRRPDFGKWTKKVRAYSKQNKLRAREEKDLIRMVQYYDSLL